MKENLFFAERFIRTLKIRIYKYMTSLSKNMYIDKLNNTYIDFKKEINDKHPKFKVCDRVRISKYKTIFAKGYIPN